VTLTLTDEIDISRGDMLVKKDEQASVTQSLQAHLVWMNETPLQAGKQYLFKFASKVTSGAVSTIEYRVDVNTQEHLPAADMQLNDIAVVNVSLEQKVVVDAYSRNRSTGAFIMIDRLTNATVAAGMVRSSAAKQAEMPQSDFSAF